MVKRFEQIIIFMAVLIGFSNCNKNSEKVIPIIDLESAVSSPSEIKCSDFIESIEYIPLETNENCLVGNSPSAQIMSGNIIVQTFNECLIFETETGKFKYRVARQGRGPGEYRSTMRIVDPINKTIFFRGTGSQIFEYSLQNELVNEIQIPDYDGSLETPSLPTDFFAYNNMVFCYFTNITGDEKKLIMAVRKNNSSPEFIIPNKNVFDHHEVTSFSTGESDFYTFDNHLYFKEIFNDTVFSVQDSVLVPHLIINSGKYLYSYKMKEGLASKPDKIITPRNIKESNRFLCFDYFINSERHIGLYSKEDQNLIVAPINEGIKNDIDNFVNFTL